MDAHALQFKRGADGNGVGPGGTIIVAPHHGQRRKTCQCVQHAVVLIGSRADVAGVNEVIAARQRGQRLRTQETVGVGNQADLQGATPQVANSGSDSASRSA